MTMMRGGTRSKILLLGAAGVYVLGLCCRYGQSSRGSAVPLFPVKQGGRWGDIDRTGTLIIKPQFDEATAFSDDLAGVEVGSRWGFIDKSGRYVAKPQFDDPGYYSEGLADLKRLLAVWCG